MEENKVCEICGKNIEELSGNPDLWGVTLFNYTVYPAEPRDCHLSCVSKIIDQWLTGEN